MVLMLALWCQWRCIQSLLATHPELGADVGSVTHRAARSSHGGVVRLAEQVGLRHVTCDEQEAMRHTVFGSLGGIPGHSTTTRVKPVMV